MKREEFGKILAMRAALWDNAKQLTQAQEEIWFQMLEPLDAMIVRAALTAYSRDGQAFAPVVGQLFSKALELADTSPDWGSAWKEMRDRCSGALGRPEEWSHPVVWEAARQITLEEIGNSTRGDAAFEAQCRGVYQDCRSRYQEGERYAGITSGRSELRGGVQSLSALLGPRDE